MLRRTSVPEAGLLGLRKAAGVFANLRPVRTWPALIDSSPLKNHVVEGTDMIIVRELTGGLYYGQPRGIDERSRLQHHVLHARRDRARRAHGVQAGAAIAARRSPASTNPTCWKFRSSGAKW